jgi:N-acyl-L-homoserine lactone synthetase
MLLTIDARNRVSQRTALRAMFEARKKVFVDILKWDVPVLDGRYEVDLFDDGHAVYLILVDETENHLASARLLPTTRPGILNSIFRHLVTEDLPEGDDVFEITRFCLSPDIGSRQRRMCRDILVTAIARYAMERGIKTYTGLAELGWLRQILNFGWQSELLGIPQEQGGSILGALRIDIDVDTLERLERAGIHDRTEATPLLTKAA